MSLAAVHNRAVLAALRGMGGKTVAHLSEITDLAIERVETALERLLKTGEVRQAPNGLWYPN